MPNKECFKLLRFCKDSAIPSTVGAKMLGLFILRINIRQDNKETIRLNLKMCMQVVIFPAD